MEGQSLPVRQILGRAWVAIEVREYELRVLEAVRVLEECVDTLGASVP